MQDRTEILEVRLFLKVETKGRKPLRQMTRNSQAIFENWVENKVVETLNSNLNYFDNAYGAEDSIYVGNAEWFTRSEYLKILNLFRNHVSRKELGK